MTSSNFCRLILLAALAAVAKEIAAQVPGGALQATLQVPLDTSRLHVGSPVLAAAAEEWRGPECRLKFGAIVFGHVTDVAFSKAKPYGSRLTLLFDAADCSGHRAQPIELKLIAVIDTLGDTRIDAGDPGVFTQRAPDVPIVVGSHITLMTSESTVEEAPSKIHPGQVIGVHKVTMSIGTGVDGGTVLSSPQKSILLYPGTQLVLSPRNAARTSSTTRTASLEPVEAPRPPSPPVDLTEICSAHCSVATEEKPQGQAAESEHAGHVLPVSAFGYLPSRNNGLRAFDHDITLHYLSKDEILLTFDAHQLRRRNLAVWPESVRRIVRALLIDTRTFTVKREVEWEVDQAGAYLWSLGRGRVVVSTGAGIREYGPGLTLLSTLPFDGRVLWVAASPAAGYTAIGVRRERHTRETHELMVQLSHRDPAEDLEVHLLGPDRTALSTSNATTNTAAPVLSDTGELYIKSEPADRWQIQERRWDGTEHPIAALNSKCPPAVATPVRGTIFVVGCASLDEHWYRLIRMNGSLLLKGTLYSHVIEPRADGGDGPVFAVRTVETTLPIPTGGLIYDHELAGEQINVYRATDGHRLFTAHNLSLPASSENFALSPDGRQLAVLTRGSIVFYRIPAP